MRLNFILLFVFGLGLPWTSLQAAETKIQKGYRQDVEELLQILERDYAYRDQKRLNWSTLKSEASTQVASAKSIQDFIRVLEQIMDATYDPHNMLNTNLKDSWRPVPHDVWAEQTEAAWVIRQVRPDSAAERAGVKPGQILQKINGIDVKEAVLRRLPKHLLLPDPAAQQWALLSAVGGARGTPRVFEVE